MRLRTLWLIVGIVGGIFALLTCGGALLLLALTLASGNIPTAVESLPTASIIGLGLGAGTSLMLHGWAAWRGQPSRPFNPSRVWLMGFAWLLLVGLGAAASSLPSISIWLLPPIHVLAMALPPLIVLWSVGWALRGTAGSWREVITGMIGGGVLGMGGALIGEGLLVLAFVVIIAVVTLLLPEGTEQITALASNLENPAWLADFANLSRLLLSPPVAISVLGTLSIPVPLIEETFKTLAAGIVARWVRPHTARAFLWGVAGGAGFALVENLFNGALGSADAWAMGAIARFGATMMHCVAGGLVGWGWGQFWTERRVWRLLGAYVVAVVIHGVWNAITASAVLLSASAFLHGEGDIWRIGASIGMLIMLGVLTVTFAFALPWVGRKLATKSPQRQDSTADPEKQIPIPTL